MIKFSFAFYFCLFPFFALPIRSVAQSPETDSHLNRPKMVIGIVVDQMRWDYLYRYYDRYKDDGFKRLLNEGFACENTFINYLPSYTAVGHSSVFTGSVPAINGITGNNWIDQATGKSVYCTDDSTVQTVGSTSVAGKMSPRNMWTSTITDELRLATNKQSKVVGISLKDRASILPAGHMANGAFWLDDATGNFITSSYYMQDLPQWVDSYNREKKVAHYMVNTWKTLYPISTYTNSTTDFKPYEGTFAGENRPVFPHNLKNAYKENKSSFRYTPFGNTLIFDFAKSTIENYQLGHGNATDFLTINCASTDYVGHKFGPNSIEAEDTYLRLDKELADFLHYLDANIGKGNYLLFLTADHGAAHAAGFMNENKLPGGLWDNRKIADELNDKLTQIYGTKDLIRGIINYQVNFNWSKLEDDKKPDIEEIKHTVIDFLYEKPEVLYAVDLEKNQGPPVPEAIRQMMVNGYNKRRSGSIQFVLKPGYFDAFSKKGTTHGAWNPYDTHIPLLFMGWHIDNGQTYSRVNITDIAPTLAALLHIQMPNGSVGEPISEMIESVGNKIK